MWLLSVARAAINGSGPVALLCANDSLSPPEMPFACSVFPAQHNRDKLDVTGARPST